jgi:glycerate dehydrogenase
VFALLLELTLDTGHHTRRVREGAWAQCPDFTFRESALIELAERTMGIIGFGRIGRRVAEIATAFGMTVVVATRTRPRSASVPVEFVSVDALFRRSDVVSLHCPLTPETQCLVSEATLALMKPGAYLINTSRGLLVDESALAKALREGQLAGAGLDVLSREPPAADHPLATAPRCIITPHVGWGTVAARRRLMREAVENVRAFLAGEARNVVS